MPLYFAYGSNMDLAAMRGRCPGAELIGPARLPGHRFALMGRSGYATVRSDRGSTIHGLLFQLAPADVGPLDRYEDVAHGLYRKATRPVIPTGTVGARQALVYFGADRTDGGEPPPGYMECIVAAARAACLPSSHLALLEELLPSAARQPAARTAVGGW